MKYDLVWRFKRRIVSRITQQEKLFPAEMDCLMSQVRHLQKRFPHTTSAQLIDELVIYHPETCQAYLLNPLVAKVYQEIETLDCRDLESLLESDIGAAVAELVNHDLVALEGELTGRREFLFNAAKLTTAAALITLISLPSPVAAASAILTVTFTTAGTFFQVVPMGATSVAVSLRGGDGGRGGNTFPGAVRNARGANGATSSGSFAVTAGETLSVTVGAAGSQGGTNSGATSGSGGMGGTGNPAGANGSPGASASTLGGAGGGGAGGATFVSGLSFTSSADGGTGGGGQAGVPGFGGASGTAGGAGEISSSSSFGNGGAGGIGATGTGDGSGAAGSVTLIFT